MQKKSRQIDSDGTELTVGDSVELIKILDELVGSLPTGDQTQIRSQIGNNLEVQGFDEHGNIELEFEGSDDTIHTIWVSTACVRKMT